MKAILVITALVICLTMIIGNAFAWGVVHEENHIIMAKGESRQFYTSLQNNVSDASYGVTVSITGGGEVASLGETEFDLPPQTRKLPVYIDLSIPQDTQEESYIVGIKYKLSGAGGNGQVGLSLVNTIFIYIDIESESEPEPEPEPDSDSQGSDTIWKPPIKNETEPESVKDDGQNIISYPALDDTAPKEKADVALDEPLPQLTGNVAVTPFRFPFEWVIIIAVVAVVVYMFLPPKEDKQFTYGYQPVYVGVEP